MELSTICVATGVAIGKGSKKEEGVMSKWKLPCINYSIFPIKSSKLNIHLKPKYSIERKQLVTISPQGRALCWVYSVMSDSLHPMDCSPPGSSIHGISQARILEWVVISYSRGSSQPRD